MELFCRGGGGGGGWRLLSVLCMGIGSTVKRSLVALAQCFTLLAHPCIILLFMTINGFISFTMYNVGRFMFPKWSITIIGGISILIIIGYMVFRILVLILPKAIQCCKKCKTDSMSKIRMSGVNEGDRAFLNPGSIDYNSCH